MNGAPPANVIRDKELKASIWENEGKKGTYFTTTFAKTYEDRNGNLKDTSVFNNSDLLRISELARQAYGRTNELRQEMTQTREPNQQMSDRAARADAFLKENQGMNSGNERERDNEQER